LKVGDLFGGEFGLGFSLESARTRTAYHRVLEGILGDETEDWRIATSEDGEYVDIATEAWIQERNSRRYRSEQRGGIKPTGERLD